MLSVVHSMIWFTFSAFIKTRTASVLLSIKWYCEEMNTLCITVTMKPAEAQRIFRASFHSCHRYMMQLYQHHLTIDLNVIYECFIQVWRDYVKNVYELCHKFYLLAYFPLFLILSAGLMLPTPRMATLFWNGNQVSFPSETDSSFLVWRKQDQYWLLNSLLYVPPYLLLSPLPNMQCTALPFSSSVAWLILVGGGDSNVPSAYGKFWIAEMHPALSSLEPKVLKLQSRKQKPWPALRSLPRTLLALALKGPVPTNPSAVNKWGWLLTFVWTNFCTVTVTSYLLPFISHKYTESSV